jgi:hypothetical protein
VYVRVHEPWCTVNNRVSATIRFTLTLTLTCNTNKEFTVCPTSQQKRTVMRSALVVAFDNGEQNRIADFSTDTLWPSSLFLKQKI